ncbi:hypothetical protein LRS74_28325 [Streptomyces sp. LX-29]|uniref:hypothetical protein n=1 Tax=Streptomyces sp. LX-29 TaxID=2900152 RepID=UPI00240E54A5|nr:hypothetical protein [Streptomyces sp. LX-29]WFB10503.1 hypothetical protein LRS74_28325 [Streptomyces sp. LX-29]
MIPLRHFHLHAAPIRTLFQNQPFKQGGPDVIKQLSPPVSILPKPLLNKRENTALQANLSTTSTPLVSRPKPISHIFSVNIDGRTHAGIRCTQSSDSKESSTVMTKSPKGRTRVVLVFNREVTEEELEAIQAQHDATSALLEPQAVGHHHDHDDLLPE